MHERELDLDSKLFLYKDHHRRLFHVIASVVSRLKDLGRIDLHLFFVGIRGFDSVVDSADAAVRPSGGRSSSGFERFHEA